MLRLLLLTGCDGPDRVEVEIVPDSRVQSTLDTGGGACVGAACLAASNPVIQRLEDTAAPFDTAMREDTGWQFGDDVLRTEVGGYLDWMEPVEDGFLLLYQSNYIYLVDEPIHGEQYVDDVFGAPLLERSDEATWNWDDAARWGESGLLINEGGHYLYAYDSTLSEPVLTYDGGHGNIVSGDVTGDGVEDLVFSQQPDFDYPDIGVIDGTWRGTYQYGEALAWIDSSYPEDKCCQRVLAPGDLDGDGIGDLVAIGYEEGFVFYGPVTGEMLLSDRGSTIGLLTWEMRSAGDVDGDGRMDLVGATTGVPERGAVVPVGPEGSHMTEDDIMSEYDCNGTVGRFFQAVGAELTTPSSSDPTGLVFDLRTVSPTPFNHLWIVDGYSDGGVHSCFEEGVLVQNGSTWADHVTQADIDKDGALDFLALGEWMHLSDNGNSHDVVSVAYHTNIWGH